MTITVGYPPANGLASGSINSQPVAPAGANFADVGSVPVNAKFNPLTGEVEVSSAGIKLLRSKPKHSAVREFCSLTGVTNAATGGTVTPTIDRASPCGGSAMKLEISAGVTGHDVTISGISLPDFTAGRGKLVILACFDDPRAISQIQCFIGTDTGFGTNLRCDHRMANDTVHFSHGMQALVITPELAASNNMAVTDDVTAVRLRIQRSASPIADGVHNLPGDVAASAVATNLWIKGVYLAAETKPFVLLTFDDASTSWIDLLQPVLAARGLKATFGINKTDVGTNDALYINAAELQSLYDYGHDISSHNLKNTAFTIAGYATYLSDFRTCRDWHRANGRNRGLDYHPYVQGAHNPDLAASMQAEGVKWCRCVNARNFERPLWDYGFHGMLPSRSLGSGSSLAAAQGWVTDAELRQQDVVVMGHTFAATAADSVTWAISDMAAFLDFCIAEKAAGRVAGIGSLSEYSQYLGYEI